MKRKWWLAGAVFALTWLAIAANPNRIYFGSDDAAIAAIVNGTMSGSPDPHGVFISSALGALMAGLSTLFPGVGWYGVIVWTILALGLAGATLAIGEILPELRTRLLPMAALVGLAAPLVFRLTFTTTSIVVGGAAFLLLLASTKCVALRVSRFLLGWSVFLAIASIALRDEGFSAAAVVMVPVIIAALFTDWRRAMVFLGSVAVAFGLLQGIDVVAYSGPDWVEFRAFSEARSDILDYRLLDPNAGLEAAAWSANDAAVFRSYSFLDPTVHGLVPASGYAAATERILRRPQPMQLMSDGRLWLALALTTLVAGLLPGHQDGPWRLSWRSLGLLMVMWTGTTTLGVSLLRFRWRVFDGMVGIGLVAALLFMILSWRSTDESRWPRYAGVLLVAALLPAGYWHLTDRAVNMGSTVPPDTFISRVVDPFLALGDDVVLIGEANAVQMSAVDPLRKADIWQSLPYQASGWPTFSPVWWERSRQLGVEDAPRVLFDHENVIYVHFIPNAEERMRVFLEEHYGLVATACEVEIPGYSRYAWRFVPQSEGY